MTGTLALVGSGEYLERCRAVDEHLLDDIRTAVGDRAPRVVCLPTAASTEGERTTRRWADKGVGWFTELGCEATAAMVIDRVTADDDAAASIIAEADLVYLSGGKPGHLYDTLRGTASWRAIETVVGRGGTLAGCSAGAMVQGSHVAGFRGTSAGFGLWPGVVVFPHFDEYGRRFQSAARKTIGRGKIVVGVDGGTGLVRRGTTYRAVGEGGVHIWSGDDHATFHDEPVPAELFSA